MTALSYVYPYPAQGRADVPADEDEVADIGVRGCRSVAELYSEALGSLGLGNRVAELRMFFHHDPGLTDVLATVDVDPVREGFEFGHVFLPTAFADRAPRVRAEILLEAVHGLVGRLGQARGWDAGALEACRQHVMDADMQYRWTSAPKASPDRRHQARAAFRLAPDGYGRVSLHVVRRSDRSLVASTGEAVAFCTSPGFRRAAGSMRWHGKDEVSLVPYDFVPAMRGGRVSLCRAGDVWQEDVEDYTSVHPVPEGDARLPALAVHVEGRGSTAPEQPPRVVFVGGGPIESRRIERFHDAFRAEMARFSSAAGHDWWRSSGIRVLEVQIYYGGEQPQVRSRRSEQVLRIFVDRPDSSLRDGAPALLARAVAEEVVALARRRTGLGPHPGFTSA